jgi:sodium/potassium-transporting ATPase subunit alpha
VFARTSPAQKLIIVKACQKLGEIVAVTGDGVNDSPAIKKADLGISMGITGTDVAKDAASMILLTDDFSSLIVGIEEGRKIFDNLKKAIMYIASSQTTEIMPFFVLLVLQIPPPISTVLVLCIDLGTDLIPAISFAYEDAELGIMTRRPRSKEDHLVTIKMFTQGYGLKGMANFFSCMMAWFIVANDFGFPPFELLYTNGIKVYNHALQDVYNPTDPYFGNSNLRTAITSGTIMTCAQFTNAGTLADWLYSRQSHEDLRMSALDCAQVGSVLTFTQIYKFGECRVQQISPISNRPVCYTTEAIKYAQSAYFYSNVIGQIFNNIITKTRRESIFSQGMHNMNMFFGMSTELIILFVLAFVSPINVVFGSRDNTFMHFGIVAVPVSLLVLALEETRKYLIRNLPPDEKGRPNWF